MTIDPQVFSLLDRYVHVASMALVLGGALLLCALSVRPAPSQPEALQRLMLFAAGRYELLFWLALGALVLTGVGNLGAFGAALPVESTAWGQKFAVKLSLVLLFVLLSLVRTLLVARLGALRADALPALPALFRTAYGGTLLFGLLILFLAVSLAHGG
jgi:hypothetical protein